MPFGCGTARLTTCAAATTIQRMAYDPETASRHIDALGRRRGHVPRAQLDNIAHEWQRRHELAAYAQILAHIDERDHDRRALLAGTLLEDGIDPAAVAQNLGRLI